MALLYLIYIFVFPVKAPESKYQFSDSFCKGNISTLVYEPLNKYVICLTILVFKNSD